MKIAAVTLALAAMGLVSQSARADDLNVLNFEDLAGTAPSFFMTNYHGFMFGTNNLNTTAWFYSNQASTYYKASSGSIFLSTDFGLYSGAASEATQAISRSSAFVFAGASFSGVDQITYQLYLNSQLVYTSAPSATLTSNPVFLSSGYAGAVDSVVIVGHQGYYALDDFAYTDVTLPAAPVPEPATASMVLIGIAGLWLGRRLTVRRPERTSV